MGKNTTLAWKESGKYFEFKSSVLKVGRDPLKDYLSTIIC
jgi:hypothetical protein